MIVIRFLAAEKVTVEEEEGVASYLISSVLIRSVETLISCLANTCARAERRRPQGSPSKSDPILGDANTLILDDRAATGVRAISKKTRLGFGTHAIIKKS